MVPPEGSSHDEPVSELLRRLRPEIEQLLASYEIEETEAEGILQEILFMLIYRWDHIANRELWVLATLRRICIRRSRERDGQDTVS